MSEEPKHRTSRAGVLLVLLAVGGSAVFGAWWHHSSGGGEEAAALDTSGFDMSSAPAAAPASPAAPAAPAPPAAAPLAAAAAEQSGLGLLKGGAAMLGPRPAAPAPGAQAKAAPGQDEEAPLDPKAAAALALKKEALKNEKFVDAFVRRMEAKHPSITRYGKDWAASPELRALRDNYWRDKDPLQFVYGLARSKDFGKLVQKYATDPGIRDVLLTGLKEAPPSLMGAIGGVFQNDKAAGDLAAVVVKATGLPPSLTEPLLGDGSKVPDQDKIMAELMESAAKNQPPPPAQLENKDAEQPQDGAAANGFTPLRGR